MVSAKGFTEGAKRRACEAGVDLYRLVDAENEDWQAYVCLWVLARCKTLKAATFTFQGPPWLGVLDLDKVPLFDANGQRLGPPNELVSRRWNESLIPQEPGFHEDLDLESGSPIFVQWEKLFYPVRVRAEIEVEEEVYLGKIPLSKIQGFQNVQTGEVLTKGFTTKRFSYDLIRNDWQRLEDAETLAVTPGLELDLVILSPVPDSA